ncbi:MAG: NAD(P)-dependent dehydrogenase (short-subunit alcohol dehydrogenase family) [Ilumatobacter sp.]|jgi:NAD(P)-dependent dehydrogenase (short-subunit alcohol dehydrogenase family)
MITIINGGTQGLGEAVARKLVADGSTGLVLTGRSVDRGERLAAELSDLGTPTEFVQVDIASDDAPAKIVGRCDERFGVVNNVVNVAALTTRSTIFDETTDHFNAMMATNVKAPYFLIQAAAKLMVREGAAGSIVNVGSTSGHGGQPRLSSYSMSKAALLVMTKNLAYGLMRHGIRVNQVNPGWMDTESEHYVQLKEENAAEDWLVAAEAGRPMGRLVKPWEVANTIAFCLSLESGMMTGNHIDMDQSVQGAGNPPMPSADEVPQL